jgi:predicted kinase
MKKSNLKILILIGIAASGKSTWAKEYVRKHANYVRVNRDDFRNMLKDSSMCENKIEDMISDLVNQTISSALTKKLNVIVDNTNLKQKYIDDIINKFKHQADIDYQVFDISLNKAIERDNARDSKVGEGVIKKMYGYYKQLIDSFSFQPIKMSERPALIPNFKSSLPDAVIFDIDGTLALMKNRGAFDWEKVDRDDLNQIVSEHIHFHRNLGRKIFLVSGRDASCKKMTKDWFEFYGIPFDEMFMRPMNDFRKDTVIKEEIYNMFIKDNYNVLCVYDDRLSVCRKWVDMGLFTFTVNQGLIDF